MDSAFDIDLTGDGDELPPGVQPGSLEGTDAPPESAQMMEQVGEPKTPVEPSADEVEDARSAAELDADFDAALGGEEPQARADAVFEADVIAADEAEPDDPEPEPEPVDPGFDVDGGYEPPGEHEDESVPQPPGVDDDGSPAPEEVETPVVAAQTPPEPKPKKAAKKAPKKAAKKPAATAPATGGPPARLYFILQKEQAEVGGVLREVFVKVIFANPDDPAGPPIEGIRARNRDIALYKAGKLFGHGFEGKLLALPEGMWDEKTVRNKPRDVFKVEVG